MSVFPLHGAEALSDYLQAYKTAHENTQLVSKPYQMRAVFDPGNVWQFGSVFTKGSLGSCGSYFLQRLSC